MGLWGLLSLAGGMPAYRQLLARLEGGGFSVSVLEAARPFLAAALYEDLKRPVLLITARPENSRRLEEQLVAWLGAGRVNVFPEPDALPYQRVAADPSAGMERISVLSLLAGKVKDGQPPFIIASAPALIQKTIPHKDLALAWHGVTRGMSIDPRLLVERWLGLGYRLEETVELPGTIARRGGILDIYPASAELPVRIEFLGNTVDSIRVFDPESQRSNKELDTVDIGPATELLAPLSGDRQVIKKAIDALDCRGCSAEAKEKFKSETAMLLEGRLPDDAGFYAALFNGGCLLDYLPPGALVIIDEPEAVLGAVDAFDEEAAGLYAEKVGLGEIPVNLPRPYFTRAEMERRLGGLSWLEMASWETDAAGKSLKLDFKPVPSYAGQLAAFPGKIKELLGRRHRVVIISQQAGRLSEMLAEEDIIANPVMELKEPPQPGSITLVQGLLSGGWTMAGRDHLLTDFEIFGFVKQRRLVKRRPAARLRLGVDINPGDYVVHIEHGIARLAGVVKMKSNGIEGEYLVLEYAAGDRLYVPTSQIDRVERYIGSSDLAPVPSRLGTQEWRTARTRAREAAEEVVKELLALYAAREVVPGFAYSPDTVWQQEMEASFPYVETPDQLKVEKEVKADMAQARPMDRLVMGDVGYGKTEVAIRAAFKAVMDGKQVAVLVPTTILAQQHYDTFQQRLAAFPVKVEMLSRFRSPREQREIIEGLAAGTVDICIGTHRLLQKDVVFKDLGLLVIDEEQRFGVKHKEYLKKIKQSVDVLTLSATPIPRTMHMSLVGVRDMSVIETPPEDRLPVRTFVAAWDEHLIREAILRELERNGQVFLVHNRVQSIGYIAGKVSETVPEAKVAIAHGQMPEGELERVMSAFSRGDIDVLVCTTIIESGLDVPNANTLIINQADKFGLTQLYQLRGRVGRGGNLAYAYLLHDKGKRLTPDAEKRLRTIYEAAELGAGFDVAMRDLEIRGAGNLLGVKQSGHINAVGFGLYTRLLAAAVEEMKAKLVRQPADKTKGLPAPSVDLPLAAFIPEEYIPAVNTRLGIYQRLAAMTETARLDDLRQELIDRFGPLPGEVKNLFYAVRIKLMAAGAGIESIAKEEGQIVLTLSESSHVDKVKLNKMSGVRAGVRKIWLDYISLGGRWQEMLEGLISGQAQA